MENIELLLNGFLVALSPGNIGAALLGAVLGLIVGAMPGIGSLAGVALLLPLTYKFNPTTAIIMLGALYYSNMYGGSFSAILLNIPGDSPAVMTALDGYPMAKKKKRPGQALFTANMSSFIGGTIGMIILTFAGPALADLGLKFGPSEMTAILLIAMTSISWLVGENPIKGILITMFGILIASMGMDTLSGAPRYDFNNMYLLGGIPFTPFVIGTVGFSQVISLVNERHKMPDKNLDTKLSIKGSWLTKHDFKRLLPPALRSGFLGTFVGVLPGAGATTGSFMGYAMQKKFKNEEPLGTGAIEGIAACEAANNAAAAGAFAPLLALGIPGSGTGAVLLGGLMMWGLSPGPLLFQNEPEFAWGLISSLFLSNFITLGIAILIIPFLTKIIAVPTKYMIPIITVVCVVGSYSTTYSMYGVFVMLVSGIFSYFLQKNNYPVAPMLLSFVLAPLLESNMRKAFIISGGSLDIFFTRPITLFLMIIFLSLIIVPIVRSIFRKSEVHKGKEDQKDKKDII
ncbi:tripartite tricarboxylate transporter permease [Proteiniclasticum sp. C24MP]|uniref:tripartite tricarboxylate transporter permease n=1 Tax=Proteiniclasticum sp. C24MP TaxID=3374101 RepID=UPI003754C355